MSNLIREINDIAADLRDHFHGLPLNNVLELAVNIQRNRILEETLKTGRKSLQTLEETKRLLENRQ